VLCRCSSTHLVQYEKGKENLQGVASVFSGACDWDGGRHHGKMQKEHISCGVAGASS